MGRQVLDEGLDRAGILTVGDEQDAAPNEIDEQADIVVARRDAVSSKPTLVTSE
jgi:hypothetical protein